MILLKLLIESLLFSVPYINIVTYYIIRMDA